MHVSSRVAALAAAAALSGAHAPAAVAQSSGASSSFAQLQGAAGCLVQPGALGYGDEEGEDAFRGCGRGRALVQAEALAVSPDQRHVYAASSGTTRYGSNAVVAFARDGGTGALAFAGCVSDDGGDGRPGTDGACRDGDALLGANDVALSPDGRHAYVASSSSHGIAWLARDASTGALAPAGCVKEMPRRDRCREGRALLGATAVAVSPDGRHVYAASARSDALVVLARDGDTGALELVECVSNSGTDGVCADGTGLQGASAVAVSPDGATVYATAAEIGSLLSFTRDPDTGRLTQDQCLLENAVPGGSCRRAGLLAGAGAIAVGPDGRDVYVGSATEGAIVQLRRGDDGQLAQAGCWQHAAPEGDDAIRNDEDADEVDEEEVDEEDLQEDEDEDGADAARAGSAACARAKALGAVRELAITPDGRSLIAAGYGSLAAFDRDAAGGGLAQTGCAEASLSYKSCVEGRSLYGASGVAISADGKSMYVASRTSNAVAVFGAAVAVAARAARVSRAGIARVRLACPAARRGGCAGRLVLRARRYERRARARAAAAGPRFRIAAGATRTVSVRVPAALRRKLRGRRGARVSLLASDASRLTRASRRRVLLHRSR